METVDSSETLAHL